ncbi:MAG: hypothetical protein N2376_12505 [Clostridia bacterium]|nr:hypothetical protein [Clostridia bacterium]
MNLFEKTYQCLYDYYGPQGWWPLIDRTRRPMACSYAPENVLRERTPSEQFEICVGAILTQNTNWGNAERALVSLIQSDFLDPKCLSYASVEEIAPFIASSGYYNQKAKKLKAFAAFFLDNPKPDRDLFLTQWGLGPETVDDMLLYAFDQPVFVVDLYTKRLFSRLGVCDENVRYESLQAMIMGAIPRDIVVYKEYHALIVRHAKAFCRKSPDCEACGVIPGCRRRGSATQPSCTV